MSMILSARSTATAFHHEPSLLSISLSMQDNNEALNNDSEVGFSRRFRRMKRQMLLEAVGKEQIQQKIDEEEKRINTRGTRSFWSSHNDILDGGSFLDKSFKPSPKDEDCGPDETREAMANSSRAAGAARQGSKKAVAPAAA